MSRSDVTLEDIYLYQIGMYRTPKGEIRKMSHKKILESAAKKLKADAKHYHKEAAHAKGVKKKHEKVEEREAKSAAKDVAKRARKAHEY